MAAQHREVSHASMDELCEAFEDLGGRSHEESLLLKFDDVFLDVESVTRSEGGTVVINLQEA